MTKLFVLSAAVITAWAGPARAIDLMRTPDPCQIERLRAEPYLLNALRRDGVSRVMCWHQDLKLLTAASVLTTLIRTRVATFVDGTSPLDLSVAALTGYRLDSLVRFWEDDRAYLALVLARRDSASPDPVSQVYEISPNHFFAR